MQNQTGNYPKRWDRSGTIVDVLGHDSYLVKIDGSGRLTQRNRRFLRRFVSPSMTIRAPISVPDQSQLQGAVDDDSVESVQPALPSNDSDAHSPESVSDLVDVNTETPLVYTDTDLLEAHGPQPAPAESVATSRHRRSARKPPIYEPESGKWVVNK